MSLFQLFFKVLSLYLEARIWIRFRIKMRSRILIRIRIKVASRIRMRIWIRIKEWRIRNTDDNTSGSIQIGTD